MIFAHMLLIGKPVVKKLKSETIQRLKDTNKTNGYVAIFLLSNDRASEVYVDLKAKYAQEIGIYADIKLGKDWSKEEVLEEISICNLDSRCLGILVQLPVNKHLSSDLEEILESILPSKDIDGLTSSTIGGAAFGYTNFLGATPQSAMHILDHYELGDMKGKQILIITQSNLIGKWLTLACMHRGATILSANIDTSPEVLRKSFENADIVFTATGSKHLLSEKSMGSKCLSTKIVIDIGWGSDEGGAYGDTDRKFFQDKVAAITPVPGGVGPVTVASLFHNLTLI